MSDTLDANMELLREEQDVCYPLEDLELSFSIFSLSPSIDSATRLNEKHAAANHRLILNYLMNETQIFTPYYNRFVALSEEAACALKQLASKETLLDYMSTQMEARAKAISALKRGGVGANGYEDRRAGMQALRAEQSLWNECDRVHGHDSLPVQYAGLKAYLSA